MSRLQALTVAVVAVLAASGLSFIGILFFASQLLLIDSLLAMDVDSMLLSKKVPAYLLGSFVVSCMGLSDVVAWASPLLGEPLPPEDNVIGHVFESTCIAFLTLTSVNLVTLGFADTTTRRATVLLSVIPDLTALIAYGQLYLVKSAGAVALQSTYGTRIYPLRFLLWAHSAPSIALILSGSVGESLGQRHNPHAHVLSIFLMILAGFLATARRSNEAAVHSNELEATHRCNKFQCRSRKFQCRSNFQ